MCLIIEDKSTDKFGSQVEGGIPCAILYLTEFLNNSLASRFLEFVREEIQRQQVE